MKEDLFKLITCSNSESPELVQQLAKKYNCSQEKIYWTFRSVFGEKLRNARWNFREPSKETFLKNVLITNCKEELRQLYPNIDTIQWVGVYDRVVGVSTYKRAKEIAMLDMLPTVYCPTIDNNEAMIAACLIGDGSFDAQRRAIRIEHCFAQQGWLERKVELIKKSFPQVSDRIVYRETRNTFAWNSNKAFSGKFYEMGISPRQDLVAKLNLFGLWWLFLDDGCYYNGSQQLVSFATTNLEIGTRLAEYLRSLDLPFRVVNKHNVTLTGIENVIKFFKTVLEPFQHFTPECMKYKTTYVKI